MATSRETAITCIEVGGSSTQTVTFAGDGPPTIVDGAVDPGVGMLGIAVPGLIAGVRVVAASSLGWVDVDPAQALGLTRSAAIVLNDAEAAALGEAHLRGVSDLVYVGVGTGVGGAVVASGHVVAANRFGHTSGFSRDRCLCARTGCLETVAAGWALPDPLDAATVGAVGRAIARAVGLDAVAAGGPVVVGGGIARRYPDLLTAVAAGLPGRVVEPSAASAELKSAAPWGVLGALVESGAMR